MSNRKPVTFPLPFARKPSPTNEMAECRRADNDVPVLVIMAPRTLVELLRYRLRHIDRPLGTVPEGHELN